MGPTPAVGCGREVPGQNALRAHGRFGFALRAGMGTRRVTASLCRFVSGGERGAGIGERVLPEGRMGRIGTQPGTRET